MADCTEMQETAKDNTNAIPIPCDKFCKGCEEPFKERKDNELGLEYCTKCESKFDQCDVCKKFYHYECEELVKIGNNLTCLDCRPREDDHSEDEDNDCDYFPTELCEFCDRRGCSCE
jgi:hypothetical protein